MTDQVFSSHVPVFKVEGEVKGELARDIKRLEVEETTAGLKTCMARFTAVGPRGEATEDQLYLDGQILDFGKSLEVSIGPSDDEHIIFKGKISAIEADFTEHQPGEVTIYAEDELMELRMTRRMRTYLNKSDAQIARDIANDHGLTPEVDADGPTYDVVQQFNMNDLAFLRERARALAAEVWVRDGKLCFKSRSARRATDMTLTLGNQLVDCQLRADLAHQRTKVVVSGYDAQRRAAVSEDAGSDAIQSEVSSGRTGPTILGQAFPGDKISYRVREVPLVSGEAQPFARSEMLRRCRSFVRAMGATTGTSDMVVGSRVTLEGVGAPFEGPAYYVTRVIQTYDLEHGHRTQFEAERPTISGGS